MHAWASFLFLRYVLWLIAGIVATMYFRVESYLTAAVMLAFALLYGLFFILRNRLPASRLWMGIFAFCFLFSLGFSRTQQRQQLLQPSFPTDTSLYWLAEVEGQGTLTPKTVKVPVRLLAYQEGGEWRQASGSMLLYIGKDSLVSPPGYGDRLLVKMKVSKVPEPLNPNGFDYKGYLETKGICCQAFIPSVNVRHIAEGEKGLVGHAIAVREWASRQLTKHIDGEREEAIAHALLLGYRELLDEETNQAYATAGAMHVLAVSGLHVGVLYLFLNLLFRSWRRHPFARWAGFGLSVLLLWSYAFVSGLSPSVLRAVIMFTFVAFGVQLKWHSGIYNTLAIAAFLLLLYDPFMLWAVGFQLSFLAVFGIVYLQPRFAAWYTGDNWFLRRAWDLLAVSLAAQLATFPLGLYYFGQFPTYFFLTNLLVVPAASLMLGLGFFFLLSSLLSQPVAAVAGWLLEGVIIWVNKVVFVAEWLPFSAINISLTAMQLALLSFFLLAAILLMHSRQFVHGLLTAGLGLLLLVSCFFQLNQQKQRRKLLLYHMPGYSALQLIEGRKEYLHVPEALPGGQLSFILRPNRLAMGLASGKEQARAGFRPAMEQIENYDLLIWRGLTLAYIHSPLPQPCLQQQPLRVNYIIVARNAVKDLHLLGCYFTAGKLLIDGSNQNYVQKRLQQEAETLNLPYHLTSEAGAFELNR